MNRILEDNNLPGIISTDEAVFTENPIQGDVGIIVTGQDGDTVLGRLGIVGDVDSHTGRVLILTTGRGFGHRRAEWIKPNVKEGGQIGTMRVVGSLSNDALDSLKNDISNAPKGTNDPL